MKIKLWWQTIVMCGLAAFALATFALVTFSWRASRPRLKQLDKYCFNQIGLLRTKSEFFRTDGHKGRVPSVLVEDYRASVMNWVYFRMCTSDKVATKFERDALKCNISAACTLAEPGTGRAIELCTPAFDCIADALDQLANDMSEATKEIP